jgi:hypothetical protein
MNRIRDYAHFAAWYAGLGYIVLWPLTSSELGGRPFGAAIFCRDGALGLAELLCASARPLQMPPGLHALGSMSALFVTTRLLAYALIDTGAARGVACAADTADAAAAGSPGQAAQPFRPARRAAPELKRYRARRSLWHKLSNTPVSAELRVDT